MTALAMAKPRHIRRQEAAQRSRLLRLERQARAREEARAIAAGVDESLRLGESRGSEFVRPPPVRGDRVRPVRRMTGLEWLATRKPARISAQQRAAGEIWGAYWRTATRGASLGSAMNDAVIGISRDPIWAGLDAAGRRIHAGAKLAELNMVLFNQVSMIEALAAVCGREQTPREAGRNGHDALRIECLVCCALDMLAEAASRKAQP